jgi:hypothetical protein
MDGNVASPVHGGGENVEFDDMDVLTVANFA